VSSYGALARLALAHAKNAWAATRVLANRYKLTQSELFTSGQPEYLVNTSRREASDQHLSPIPFAEQARVDPGELRQQRIFVRWQLICLAPPAERAR